MEDKNYWRKEEFEDLVSRALIAMFETEHSCYFDKHKNMPGFKFTKQDLNIIKQIGPYFAPEERGVWLEDVGWIDNLNDGFPNIGSYAFYEPFEEYKHYCEEEGIDISRDDTEKHKQEYLTMTFIKSFPRLPNEWISRKAGKIYCYYGISALSKGGLHCQKDWYTIDKNGIVYPAFFKKGCHIYNNKNSGNLPAMTLNSWSDRKYLWNVIAKEQTAHAIFGVYEEQIKSLFYARDLPKTITGRKRPILHWVASHRRRLKEGIEIDIKKYLRGTNEFVMDGTKFEIIYPKKRLPSHTGPRGAAEAAAVAEVEQAEE